MSGNRCSHGEFNTRHPGGTMVDLRIFFTFSHRGGVCPFSVRDLHHGSSEIV